MLDPSWHPVPGYEGFYAAARSGLVTSLDRTVTLTSGKIRRYRARMLSWTVNAGTHGYPEVKLSRPGQEPENVPVHQIILRTFVGECPEGQESRHGPLGKLVPALHNLCYGTRAENIGDRIRDGQDNRGEKHSLHKLTADQVLEIRRRLADTPRGTPGFREALAAEYGIAIQHLHTLATGASWGWLEEGITASSGNGGANNARAVLTEQDVREIRRRRDDGESLRSLAEAFGISGSNVSMIALRKSWAHI